VHAGELIGVGESSPMAGGFYSEDTPEGCWSDLSAQIVPAVLGEDFASPSDLHKKLAVLNASNFAKAGVETALWDLEAQRLNIPLFEVLGGKRRQAESGLAVGLYEHIDDMLRTVERYLPNGYKRVKLKIERGRDVELVKAFRRNFGEIPLFVDANGAYTMEDVDVFRQLDEFRLLMFEQPFPGGMLEELAELQRHVKTPLCLDESLKGPGALLRAIELQAVGIANIKIQRVGGLFPALEIYEICREHAIPVWIGTMPELGVGQAQGLALSTLEHCSFPTDVEASARWFQDEIISPPIEVRDGYLEAPDGPGLGFRLDREKVRRYTVASRVFEG
jgi:O-succinylbenzoate synthase